MLVSDSNIKELQDRLNHECVFMHVVLVDSSAHPIVGDVSSIHFLFDDMSYYCVPVNHPDASSVSTLPTTISAISLHKRQSRHIDLATMLQLNGVPVPEEREFYTPIIKNITNQFRSTGVYKAIPLASWMEFGESLLMKCRELYHQYADAVDTPEFKFINNITLPTLTEIEKAGLWTIDGPVYSHYNVYTTTGRPSNSFGGVNYAALNKSDGTRDKFISRFGDNGTLVQFDYEAFHLRLIANLIGYELPSTSVHTYLAQQYYGTTEVTEEQYNESKERTFSIMYGQSDDDGGVEFFSKIKQFSTDLWNLYKKQGYIQSRITGRKIVMAEPSKHKVFNYLMQLSETEVAIKRANEVGLYLQTNMYQSKLILYTYDAILLDMHNDELEHTPVIHKLLTYGGYPVREYRGLNYGNLIEFLPKK